jgi:plasmid maintenance system antidote protein VapI
LRLAEYFGTTPDMWINLQANYEFRLARQSYWPEARERIRKLG